jgi:hypothetical protein
VWQALHPVGVSALKGLHLLLLLAPSVAVMIPSVSMVETWKAISQN